MRRTVRVGLLSCLFSGLLLGASAEQRNPFENDEAAIQIGSALFASRCSDCHGPDAKGKLGPDLTQRWARGETDESAFLLVRNGVPGSSMPPSIAPDNEIWAVVAYLRRISVVPPLVTSGDASRGRALFEQECAGCHQVSGAGGALGPDLTAIGAVRSRAALTAAVRQPDAAVERGFRTVVLEQDGARTEGVVKSEDAFSLQILTKDGELRAFAKRDLDKLERSGGSLMPAYDESRLSDAVLEDLLAYLGSLRGAR